MTISRSNSAGFTLLEVMIAMIITIVGLLGLLQSLNVATEHSRKNQLRDEAVLISEEHLNWLRAQPFDTNISEVSSATGRQSGWQYTITRKSTTILNSSSKELSVRVAWAFKNVTSAHEVHAVRSD